jgi:glutamate N-acetyltransferase/amino-acid N-acetyltransferase
MLGAGEVAVCSTGLIGERLPMQKLLPGVRAAIRGLSRDGGPAAAEAIMTTDTRPKTTVARGSGWTVGGMAKGAGMLAPQLATMLVVLTTDAKVTPAEADRALRAKTRVSFVRREGDGCKSTNGPVKGLASGASGWVLPRIISKSVAIVSPAPASADQWQTSSAGAPW